MTIKCCDVCYYQGKVLVKSGWKITYKNGAHEKVALDVCANHKGFFKGTTFEGARQKVHDLILRGGSEKEVIANAGPALAASRGEGGQA